MGSQRVRHDSVINIHAYMELKSCMLCCEAKTGKEKKRL